MTTLLVVAPEEMRGLAHKVAHVLSRSGAVSVTVWDEKDYKHNQTRVTSTQPLLFLGPTEAALQIVEVMEPAFACYGLQAYAEGPRAALLVEEELWQLRERAERDGFRPGSIAEDLAIAWTLLEPRLVSGPYHAGLSRGGKFDGLDGTVPYEQLRDTAYWYGVARLVADHPVSVSSTPAEPTADGPGPPAVVSRDQVAQSLEAIAQISDESDKFEELRRVSWAAGLHGLAGAVTAVIHQTVRDAENEDPESTQYLRDAAAWPLAELAMGLAESGDLDSALAVAEQVTLDALVGDPLEAIAIGLGESGEFDRGLEVAGRIPDKDQREIAIGDIAEELARAGDDHRSIQLAKGISNHALRCLTLADISFTVASRGNTNAALGLLDGRDDPFLHAYGLGQVGAGIAVSGDLGRALSILEGLTDKQRDTSLQIVARAVADEGKDPQAAIGIAQKIIDPALRRETEQQIAGTSLTPAIQG